MPFSRRFQSCCLILALASAAAGCATVAKKAADTQPAVIAANGSCHDAIESAMKTMIGSDRFSLPPDLFQNRSSVLLSNHIPSELLGDRAQHFSEAADRRFLLHMDKGRCLLSLIDETRQLIATQALGACQCTPEP